jgi:hypothetical protein
MTTLSTWLVKRRFPWERALFAAGEADLVLAVVLGPVSGRAG